MSVMLVDLCNQRAINKTGRHRMFACASALLWCLALYPVHAYSAQPKELVLTDTRLFHAETPEPRSVWSDATPKELRNYRNPLLVVHGTADDAEPIAEGRADYAAAGSTDRTFVAVPGKSHVGTIWSVEADDAIAAFIQKHLHAAPHKVGQSK